MKAHIKPNPNMTIEVEGENQKKLFDSMASAFEIFGEASCGKCGSKNIKPVVRKVPDGKKIHDYYEWHCLESNCLARLSLGQSTDKETLFPKRKLNKDGEPDQENGKFTKERGWNDSWKKHSKETK